MKVLITRSSENQVTGGAELSARDQCRVLKKLGHKPILLTNNSRLRNELKEQGIQAIRGLYIQNYSPPIRYILFWLGLLIKIPWDLLVVLIHKPHVINPHTREDQITLTLTKPIHRRPVVWKDPGDMVFVLTRKHGLLGRVYKNLYLYSAKKADYIYMLNDDHVALLGKILGSPNKISSIPSSILYDDYSPANLNRNEKNGSVIFGSICRLEPEKNIATLIKAFQVIRYELPDAKLVIYGDGSERGLLEEMVEGYDSITLAGWSNDVSESLNSIDIFIHPALEEGWGRNIKEAMYFGKAIIGSRVGGIKKQIEDGKTGVLFEPGNVDELAEKMMRLARDKELRVNLGNSAKEKAIKDGDFTQIVENHILPIYVSVTSRK